LNAKVVMRKSPMPKYQSLNSVHTPFLREYRVSTYVLTSATIMLVAKNVGNTIRNSCKVETLTYEKEIVRSIMAIA